MSQEPAHADPASDLDTRRRRAAYRANYRGTKEMDWLLGKFAEAKLPHMDAAALTQFEKLLQLQDPELNIWLLDPAQITQPEFAPLVAEMRAFHNISGTLDKPMTGTER